MRLPDHPAQEWRGMSAENPESSGLKHLAALVANGEVRAGDGSRYLPQPLKPKKRIKTAADLVAEARR
jgi:hypothetical protein